MVASARWPDGTVKRQPGESLFDAIVRDSLESLEQRESATVDRVAGLYIDAFAAVAGELNTLLIQIDAARSRGEVISPAWLQRQDRYVRLLADIDRRYMALSGDAALIMQQGMASADIAGMVSAHQLAAAADQDIEGPPSYLTSQLSAGKLNQPAMDRYAAATAAGSPLRDVLERWGSFNAAMIEGEIVRGMALGRNPHEVARRISSSSMLISKAKARQIARTEMMRAYRGSQVRQYGDLGISTVVWRSQLGARTCMACIAQHGTLYQIDNVPDKNHPHCRCIWLPYPRRPYNSVYNALNQTGDDYLHSLSDDQLARFIKNPELRAAYQRYDITAGSFVDRRRSDRWGETISARSERRVMEINGLATPRPPKVAPPPPTPAGPPGGAYDPGDRLDRTNGAREFVGHGGQIFTIDDDGRVQPRFLINHPEGSYGWRKERAEFRRMDQYAIRDDDAPNIRAAKEAILAGGIDPTPDQIIAIGKPLADEIDVRYRERISRGGYGRLRPDDMQNEYDAAYREVLGEIRPMHDPAAGHGFNVRKMKNGAKLSTLLDRSSGYYPAAWIDNAQAYVNSAGGVLTLSHVQRGLFRQRDGDETQIRISGYGDASLLETTTHELGHLVDYSNAAVHRSSIAFREQRTVGETPQKMSVLTGNRGYSAKEVAKPDRFIHPYMGKVYPSDRSSEITTMGMEYTLHHWSDLVSMEQKDPEYVHYIIGLLAGH